MNHSDSIVSVYSDARAEYTKQLCVFLVPSYFRFFLSLLERARETMINEPKRVLWQFQNYLAEIPEWNMDKVSSEIDTIQRNCGCEYLEDLLTAVFIAHTKVLTAIRISAKQKKIQITVPKVEHFLFRALCESSKLLWSSSYLFRDGIPSIEKQQNYRTVEQLLHEAILQAVRGLVPVKSILKDFVSLENDEDEEDENQTGPVVSANALPQTDSGADNLGADNSGADNSGADSSGADSSGAPVQNTVVEQSYIPPSDSTPTPMSSPESVPTLPSIAPAPMIVVDTSSGVNFTDFDAVFDSDHPENSDMIFEPKNTSDADADADADANADAEFSNPGIQILEEIGVPLDQQSDVENLDGEDEDDNDGEYDSRSIASNEYETL